MPTGSPRDIAKRTNDAGKFDSTADSSYDGVAGTPAGVAPQGPPPDYAANPTLPADPPPPAKNLKR